MLNVENKKYLKLGKINNYRITILYKILKDFRTFITHNNYYV